MKTALWGLAALALFNSAQAATNPCAAVYCIDATVVGVTDGDTLTVVEDFAGDRRRIRVRLAQIDAPERGQPWSANARQALATKVFQQPVQIVPDGNDRYGRLLARVFIGERDINRELVQEGHAWVYRAYASDVSLVEDERTAKERLAGLWSLPDTEPVAPWIWRRGEDGIDLLLQNPLAHDAPADRCSPPACTRLAQWLDSARESIDFAIYGARNQSRILAALIDAKRRGVRLRGFVDRSFDGTNYYSSTDEWVRRLGGIADDRARERRAEVNGLAPRCRRPAGFAGPLQCLAYDLGASWLLAEHASRENFVSSQEGGVNRIMHNKFFVIDNRRVWTGSANISDSGTGGYNANAVLAVESKDLAGFYTAEFERLLARGARRTKIRGSRGQARSQPRETELLRMGDARLSVLFSPQDEPMENGVRPLLASARERIDMAIFFLTHKRVVADLIAAHRRGVKLRVIVDATSARNGYTKHELLRTAGVPTKIENWGGKMHAKAAAIDGEYLILGSMNWTAAGERDNDENTLLIHSPRLATQFDAWFDDLWESVPDAWLAQNARPDPESRDSGSACFDGVDNDFDELADDADPGCGRLPPSTPDLPPHRVVQKSELRFPRAHRLHSAKTVCSPENPHPLLAASGRCPDAELAGLAGGAFQCGTKRFCGEMASCAEARFFLAQCGLSRLDGNSDGVPCEKICRRASRVEN